MSRVWKFGDHIDTDIITPAQYITGNDREEFAKHAMKPVAPEFGEEVQEGDILIAGINFGCGSSRESAPIALLECGLEAVVAKSFSRIFFRNAINIGLPVYICSSAYEGVSDNDVVSVDHENSIIINESRNTRFKAEPHPNFIQDVIEAGGLLQYQKEKKSANGSD
jgi:3-isopropylmalate/(R)-2-methylmalate dehydratase small subunit